MIQELSKEQEEKTKVKFNIYRVPIEEISFIQCMGNETMQGSCLTNCYEEGRSPQEAVLNLTKCPDYWENWNNAHPSFRKSLIEKGFKPFKIDLEHQIEQIPVCNERHKTKFGHYVCGPPCTDGEYDLDGINGEFGDCICTSPWTNRKDDLRSCCPYRKLLRD